MKKLESTVVADEPMGIAWCSGAQSAPRVKAYFWCSDEYSVVSQSEDVGHSVKR